jgi:hypothetical protein
MKKIFSSPLPVALLVFSAVAGLFSIISMLHGYYFYINHIEQIAKEPKEINQRFKELNVIECYGTFIDTNPFEKKFIAIYVLDKRKDKNGEEFIKFKYDTGYSTENVDKSDYFKRSWEYRNCSQVVQLDAKYPSL